MALYNIYGWKAGTECKAGSACGSACGSDKKPSACGSACGADKKASACGFTADRDFNASLNIRDRGLADNPSSAIKGRITEPIVLA